MTEYAFAQSMFNFLLSSERFSKSDIYDYQITNFAKLYEYARNNVPLYREYPALDFESDPRTAWQNIPFLTRSVLSGEFNQLVSERIPEGHGDLLTVPSGGSTGEPVQVVVSDLEASVRVVATYRIFQSWKMDLSRPLFMVRRAQNGQDRTDKIQFRKWGFPWLPESQLGDRCFLDIRTPPDGQLEQLSAKQPVYINTLPSNILRLALKIQDNGASPCIPFTVSVAEYLAPEVRRLAEQVLGTEVISVFSSAEAGIIAAECPVSRMMHIQSEFVIAEILDEDGRKCEPGETGELVVTTLYNYAMPIIRYRTGDFVEAGGDCACGRTLTTIRRFVGRHQHMFNYADGSRSLPEIDRVKLTRLLKTEEWVFAQTAAGKAELRSELGGIDTAVWEEVHDHLATATRNEFSISFIPHAKIPLTSAGKRQFTQNDLALKAGH